MQLIEKAVLVCSGIVEYIIKYIRTNPFTTLLLCCLTLPGSNSFCRKWCLIGFSYYPKVYFGCWSFLQASSLCEEATTTKQTNTVGKNHWWWFVVVMVYVYWVYGFWWTLYRTTFNHDKVCFHGFACDVCRVDYCSGPCYLYQPDARCDTLFTWQFKERERCYLFLSRSYTLTSPTPLPPLLVALHIYSFLSPPPTLVNAWLLSYSSLGLKPFAC